MTERPIIFSGPMIPRLLDDSKTQTRRTRGLDKINEDPDAWKFIQFYADEGLAYFKQAADPWAQVVIKCPFGVPGDRLWVKENYWDRKDRVASIQDLNAIHYAADGFIPPDDTVIHYKKSSLFMPRWASRIDLLIKDIRLERLGEITEGDAIKEGWPKASGDFSTAPGNGGVFDWFRDLWDSLNAQRGMGWDKNPYVWVIESERVKP